MSRLFISYGRADAGALAARLVNDLTREGHTVWLDRHEIKAGRQWEEEIENGILQSDAVIALLSPHAVRRPDGICLDEISLARHTGRRIIPVMVLPCRPPLAVYRLDWIDFQDWQVDTMYPLAFARLSKAIGETSEGVEGAYAALFSRLRPLDFGREVSRLTRQFVGRQWLVNQVDEWLGGDNGPLFLVTGEPGIGKSALLASLIHRHPRVRAYHFCIANLADSLDPVRFVRSIAAQLATQLASYRAALEAIDPVIEREPDPGTLFRRLIVDPLCAETAADPVLIVIDALDESVGYAGRHIAKLIAERLSDLPRWVRVVASSRENPEILDLFSSYHPQPIRGAHENNLRDATLYVDGRLSNATLAPDVDPNAVREAVLSRSKGNFLYLCHTLDALCAGRIDPRVPEAFPDGLIGVYYSFFERVFQDSASFDRVRPLLDVVVASREPLTAYQIGGCVNLHAFDVEQRLQQVIDLIPERDGRYQAFHKSLTDWLLGVAGQSRRFRVNRDNGYQLLASWSWQEYERSADDMSDHAVRHGLYYVQQAGRRAEERRLCADSRFIHRRLRTARGIYFSFSYRGHDLVARLLTGLIGAGHDVFIQSLTDSEEEWRRNIASAIPSVGVVVGFAYARNSPYLRQEWRVALSNGVPLILMIAEETPWLSTASELDSAPRFDMREWHSSEAEYSRLWSQISTFFGEGTRVSQEASEVGHVIRVGKVPVVDIKKLGMMMPWQPKADNVWEIDDGPALVNHVRPEDALVQDEVSAVCRAIGTSVGRVVDKEGCLNLCQQLYGRLRRFGMSTNWNSSRPSRARRRSHADQHHRAPDGYMHRRCMPVRVAAGRRGAVSAGRRHRAPWFRSRVRWLSFAEPVRADRVRPHGSSRAHRAGRCGVFRGDWRGRIVPAGRP
jgi:TIR domain/AAA ATPase domain